MGIDSPRRGFRARAAQLVAAITALALAVAGCSYHSTYVPPPDGRARVVWKTGDVVGTELASPGLTEQCREEVTASIDNANANANANAGSRARYYGPTSGDGIWVPRFYGSPIIVVQPGLAPPYPRSPLLFPHVISPPPTVRVGGSVALPRGGSSSITHGGSSITHGGGGGSHGGGGGGKDFGILVVVLLVIAVSLLPAISLGLAASMPESASSSASATDFVNAYNDLSRLNGSPCAPAIPQGMP